MKIKKSLREKSKDEFKALSANDKCPGNLRYTPVNLLTVIGLAEDMEDMSLAERAYEAFGQYFELLEEDSTFKDNELTSHGHYNDNMIDYISTRHRN